MKRLIYTLCVLSMALATQPVFSFFAENPIEQGLNIAGTAAELQQLWHEGDVQLNPKFNE
ncbi:MAG: hypothetical protein PVJ92_00135 [Candidatus Dependentiae bacterium]